MKKLCLLPLGFLLLLLSENSCGCSQKDTKYAMPSGMVIADLIQAIESDPVLYSLFTKSNCRLECRGDLLSDSLFDETACKEDFSCVCQGQGVISPEAAILFRILADESILIQVGEEKNYTILGDLDGAEDLYDLGEARRLNSLAIENFKKLYSKELEQEKQRLQVSFKKALDEQPLIQSPTSSAVVRLECCRSQIHRFCLKDLTHCPFPFCKKEINKQEKKRALRNFIRNDKRHDFCGYCGESLKITSSHKKTKRSLTEEEYETKREQKKIKFQTDPF